MSHGLVSLLELVVLCVVCRVQSSIRAMMPRARAIQPELWCCSSGSRQRHTPGTVSKLGPLGRLGGPTASVVFGLASSQHYTTNHTIFRFSRARVTVRFNLPRKLAIGNPDPSSSDLTRVCPGLTEDLVPVSLTRENLKS